MDVIDIGSELAEFENEYRVKAARIKATHATLPFLGHCYNCEDPLENRNFCNVHCRDEYDEYLKKIKRKVL